MIFIHVARTDPVAHAAGVHVIVVAVAVLALPGCLPTRWRRHRAAAGGWPNEVLQAATPFRQHLCYPLLFVSSPIGGAPPALSPAPAGRTMPPSTALLHAILATLPPATYAVAYGSGAVPQAASPAALPVSGQENPPEGATPGVTLAPASGPPAPAAAAATTDAKVVDFLLAVDDVRGWHAANLAANSSHYAVPLRWAGPAALAAVQQWRWGGGVYYNTLVPWAGRVPAAPAGAATASCNGARGTTDGSPPPPVTRRLIKYGVISTDALTADLTGWTSLYAAGRLHKPVVTLTPPPRGLAAALGANVAAATAAAVLLLPPAFSAAALHATAAGLSYAGDVRSAVVAAEDPAKVDRLVAGDAAGAAYGAL